jgi:two-component system sensor histidine kinase KdpD
MLLNKFSLLIILLLTITLTSYQWSESLGLTGISMLYLLFVVGVAYHYSKNQAVIVAFASFLIINYLFIEPKFTFQVGNAASWASLISFLIVSVVITSLVKRLRVETLQSQQTYLRAEFLRKLAENLSYPDTIQGLLEDCQALLEKEFGSTVLIVKNGVPILGNYTLTSEQCNAIAWVQANGKSFGIGTNNWADANFVIFPFNRLQSYDPVVLIPQISPLADSHLLGNIKLAVVHIAVAYQHLMQKEKTLAAENQAREEAIRSALLASIAHDMRTPLTDLGQQRRSTSQRFHSMNMRCST